MIAIGCDEYLCLARKPAEGDRVDDPVTVALEGTARAACALFGLRKLAPPAGGGISGIRGA